MVTSVAYTTGLRPAWDAAVSAAARPDMAGSAVVQPGTAGPPPARQLQVVVSEHRYLNRPVLVAADLAMLTGPSAGVVTLPVELYWSSDEESAVFDLANPVRRKALYRIVLRESRRPDQLAAYLNADVLLRVWPSVARRLPAEVRAAWQEQHPELEAAAPRAA